MLPRIFLSLCWIQCGYTAPSRDHAASNNNLDTNANNISSPRQITTAVQGNPSSNAFGVQRFEQKKPTWSSTSHQFKTELRINLNNTNEVFDDIVIIALVGNSFQYFVKVSRITVDKTLLIYEILKYNKQTVLITCPRKWGKTISVLMLRAFLEIVVDEHGNRKPRDQTDQYKLFKYGDLGKGKKLDNGFLICTEKAEFCEERLGKTPVLFVTFDLVRARNYTEFLTTMHSQIYRAYERHNYLEDGLDHMMRNEKSSTETKTKARKYMDYLRNNAIDCHMNSTQLEDSLSMLVEMLHFYFNEEVFVIVDKYDTPLVEIFTDVMPECDRIKCRDFYITLLSKMLVNNEMVKGSVLIGVFKVSKKEFLPELNNLNAFSFLDNPFYYYYGINYNEILAICKQFDIFNHLDGINLWYNGYRTALSKLRIINPFNVVYYLVQGSYQPYWEGGTGSIRSLLPGIMKDGKFLKEAFYKLLCNQTIRSMVEYKLEFTSVDLRNLKDPLSGEGGSIERALKVMLAVGYLTLSDDYEYQPGTELELRFPNYEILYAVMREYWKTMMPEKEVEIFQEHVAAVSTALKRFFCDDKTTINYFENALTKYFWETPVFNFVSNVSKNSLTKYFSKTPSNDSASNFDPGKPIIEPAPGNEILIQAFVHFAACTIDMVLYFQPIEGEIRVDDAVFKLNGVFFDNRRAVIIDYKYHNDNVSGNLGLVDDLLTTKNHRDVELFSKQCSVFENIDDMKIISLWVFQNNTVKVRARLFEVEHSSDRLTLLYSYKNTAIVS